MTGQADVNANTIIVTQNGKPTRPMTIFIDRIKRQLGNGDLSAVIEAANELNEQLESFNDVDLIAEFDGVYNGN